MKYDAIWIWKQIDLFECHFNVKPSRIILPTEIGIEIFRPLLNDLVSVKETYGNETKLYGVPVEFRNDIDKPQFAVNIEDLRLDD